MSETTSPQVAKSAESEVDVVEAHFAELGMPNYQTAREQIDFLIRTMPGEFAVLLCDADGLKEINDEHGHEMGDQLIINAGDVLFRAAEEAHGTISLGRGLSPNETDRQDGSSEETTDQHHLPSASHRKGDEFVVVLPGFEGQKQVDAFINDVQEELGRRGISMTMSGRVHKMVALENEFTDPESASELLRSADSLLQWDKGLKKTREMTPDQIEIAERIGKMAADAGLKLRDLPKIVDFLPFIDYVSPLPDAKRDPSSLGSDRTVPKDSSDPS